MPNNTVIFMTIYDDIWLLELELLWWVLLCVVCEYL